MGFIEQAKDRNLLLGLHKPRVANKYELTLTIWAWLNQLMLVFQ
jgi:hypothetical protein